MLVYSDLQQSIAVEGEGNSLAVNRRVVGSSPTYGAVPIGTKTFAGFWAIPAFVCWCGRSNRLSGDRGDKPRTNPPNW
jgi:hypothetical protein